MQNDEKEQKWLVLLSIDRRMKQEEEGERKGGMNVCGPGRHFDCGPLQRAGVLFS